MTSRIFKTVLAVGLTVILLCMALFLGVLYQYFGGQLELQLQAEAAFAAQGIERSGMSYLEDLDTPIRVTLVGADGTVLYDNQADPATMENHAGRPEIQQALKSETGSAQRTSSTLSQRTLYYAQRLSDGSVLRLSAVQYTLPSLLSAMAQPLFVILVLTLTLSGILAYRLSRWIIRPILAIDLEHPQSSQVYDELSPLLTRIRTQNATITQQIAQLSQTRKEFSALTENMSEGFLLLDRERRVLAHNSSALRLLNAAPPQEARPHVLTLNRTQTFSQAVEQSLAGSSCQAVLEEGERCCQVLANPVFQDGQVTGAVLVILDISERHKGEALRREFTANVSHELRTPLTAISGMAEILRNGLVKPEDVQGFADDIYHEARRLIDLVEDILRLSRLDEGGVPPKWEELDLLELARDTAQRLQSAAQSAQVTVEVSGEAGVVRAVLQVAQEIVYNLCDNAIKYNRPGGRVSLNVSQQPQGVVLRVEDTGIGIPPEDVDRVFERFYRVDKSHSRAIGGTGLGLSIVKHGAAFLGARVTLTSQLGHGSTFTLTFPHPRDIPPDAQETSQA